MERISETKTIGEFDMATKRTWWWNIEDIDKPRAMKPYINKVVTTISKEYYGGHIEREPSASITAPLERRKIVSMSGTPPGNVMLTHVRKRR